MGSPDTPAKEKAVKKIQHAVFPLTASSTHLGRLPALGIACLEMKLFGQQLAAQIVKNAQTAGQYLCENGVTVVARRKVSLEATRSLWMFGASAAVTE
jgi:glycine/serine hydroxymethyltransferase